LTKQVVTEKRKRKSIKMIAIRIPEEELQILKSYCDRHYLTQTSVIRGYIRRLRAKL